jgi:hypothetical protein
MIFANASAALSGAYPDRPAKLLHDLQDGGLFEIGRLLRLAQSLPAASIEYNAGDLPLGQDPAKTPMNGLSAEETIKRIAECRSWMVMKNVEQDAEYAALMERCLAEIVDATAAATGPMHRKEAFVFLSSPGAVTPFHMDPEHNILMQVGGEKTIHIYPSRDYSIVSPEQHEAYHENGHRNLAYSETFEEKATAFDLRPGDAVYVPVKAPHRVKVAGDVAISFSITWRSRLSDAEARVHHVNHALRRFGVRPRAPGEAPASDAVKVMAHRIFSKLAPKR